MSSRVGNRGARRGRQVAWSARPYAHLAVLRGAGQWPVEELARWPRLVFCQPPRTVSGMRALPTVTTLPLAAATTSQVAAAFDAVADSLRDPDLIRDKMRQRHAAAQEGAFPPAFDLLVYDGEPAGWVGWAPYASTTGIEEVWESTIFFWPSLRGAGILPLMLCHQTHLAERLPDGAPLISSIGDWNIRSIRAHRSWAQVCGWIESWEVRTEEDRGRVAHVLHWPDARPISHPCHRVP